MEVTDPLAGLRAVGTEQLVARTLARGGRRGVRLRRRGYAHLAVGREDDRVGPERDETVPRIRHRARAFLGAGDPRDDFVLGGRGCRPEPRRFVGLRLGDGGLARRPRDGACARRRDRGDGGEEEPRNE